MLQQTGSGRPSQFSLRRAISATYYAMFHALARNGADMLVGTGPELRASSSWRHVYRGLEHLQAREICQNAKIMKEFPESIRDFGKIFVVMQQNRHEADYNPHERFTKASVTSNINDADRVIKNFKNADDKSRRKFSTLILFKRRKPQQGQPQNTATTHP